MAVWSEESRDMSDPKVVFGAHVRALRLAAGVTPRQLAEGMRKAGHPQWRENLIANVQNGRRAVHVEELPHLAAILDVTLEELLAPTTPTPVPEDAIPEAWDLYADEVEGLARVFNAPPAEIIEVLSKHYGRDLDAPPKPATITVRVGQPDPESTAQRPRQSEALKFAPWPGQRARVQALVSPAGVKSEAHMMRELIEAALPAFEAHYRPVAGTDTAGG